MAYSAVAIYSLTAQLLMRTLEQRVGIQLAQHLNYFKHSPKKEQKNKRFTFSNKFFSKASFRFETE